MKHDSLSREHVSTASESSGGAPFNSPADSWHSPSCVQLLDHGNNKKIPMHSSGSNISFSGSLNSVVSEETLEEFSAHVSPALWLWVVYSFMVALSFLLDTSISLATSRILQ